MFNFMALVQFMIQSGNLVMKVISGKATDDEIKQVVDEVYLLLQTVPQLAPFASIIGLMSKIIQAVLMNLNDADATTQSGIKVLMSDAGVTEGEIKAATGMAGLFVEVMNKAIENGEADVKHVDDMAPQAVLDQI